MRKYYIQTGKKLSGPFSVEELKSQPIDFHSKLCEQGSNEWKPINEISDFELIKMDLKPDLLRKPFPWKKIIFAFSLLAMISLMIVGGGKVYEYYKNHSNQEQYLQVPADSVLQDSIVQVKKISKPISFDTNLTNFSCLISGIIPDSKRSLLEDDESWINVQNLINEEWEKVVEEKILPIQEWRDESSISKLDSSTLFYPFAGADFLYSNNFFPKSNKIIMIGLEPVGSINTEKAIDGNFYEYVKKIKSSLYMSNRSGYFMTLKMGKELHQSDLNGVLPLLLFYAKRQAYLISKIEYLKIDDLGKVTSCSYENADGVRLSITDSEQKTKKTIEYFRTDLSNIGFSENSKFYLYFSQIEQKNVFLKAASYLLHYSSFSNIRDVILNKTNVILQDDSGLPFSFVNNENWETELFGKYTRPIGLFRERVQPVLRQEFLKREAKPLPFRIGYNISHNEPHLILAKRKQNSPKK